LSNATDGQSAARPARLVIMGPQGAGKGTQAARLAEQLSIPAISTGDIFRANIKGGTELGRLAQEYTAKGDLVPDSVTNAMVRDRLAQDDAAQGFILDGYPRNAAQVVELDAILADLGRVAPSRAASTSTRSRRRRSRPPTTSAVCSSASTASVTSTRSPSASSPR